MDLVIYTLCFLLTLYFWYMFVRNKFRKAGIKAGIPSDAGNVLEVTNLGSVEINGVLFKKAIMIYDYKNGFAIVMQWLYGAKKFYILRSDINNKEYLDNEDYTKVRLSFEAAGNKYTFIGTIATKLAPMI
ncbi:MAG: hypothetical protein MK193_02880 [Lentisphaeria bacterium]|nr:hypothetical protein [Lentisphaeria bacterium]